MFRAGAVGAEHVPVQGVPLREYFKGWGDVPPLDFKLAPEPTNTKRRKKSRGKASKNPGG